MCGFCCRFRPIVFSVDDSQEYQADFVLATLLDTDAPAHSSQSHGSSVQAAQKRQRAYGGEEESYKTSKVYRNQDEFSRMEEDGTDQDTILEDTSAGRVSKGGRKQQPATAGKQTNGHSVGRRRGASSTSSQGPSGPSRTQSYVPPPPVDIDSTGMDVDSALFAVPAPRIRNTSRMTGPVGGDAVTGSHKDYDPIDALFEFENQNDVADDGNMFGVDSHRNPHTAGATGAAVETRGKGKGKGKGRSTQQTDALNIGRSGSKADIHGEDNFFDDFPYRGQCVNG